MVIWSSGYDSSSPLPPSPPEQPPAQPKKRVTAEDFKGSNVQKVVLSECAQHPATILPAAGSVVAAVATVVVSAGPASIGVAVALAFVSASAFIWNYVIKGEDRARERIEQLREQRRLQMVGDFDMLAYNCRVADFELGRSKCDSLKQSYLNLLQYLKAHEGTSVDGFRFLAEDTLKQGLQTLGQALDMFKAMQAVDGSQLRAELARFVADLKKLDAGSARAKTTQLSIDDRQARIDLLSKNEDQLNELLLHADEIEAALQKTYLELTALGQADPTTFLGDDGGAASRLKSAVEAARRVEESLRGNAAADAALRSKYLAQADGKSN